MADLICSNCNFSLTIKKTSDKKIQQVEVKKPEILIEYYNKKKIINNYS